MNKLKITRKYNFSDTELIYIANKQLKYITRDIEEFKEYSSSQLNLTIYIKSLQAFVDYPTDVILESEKVECIARRNEIRKEIETAIRDIHFIAKLTFSKTPDQIKQLGNAYLSKQSETQILATAQQIGNIIGEYRQGLAENGLTNAKFDNFNKIHEDLKNTIKLLDEATIKRKQATSERIILANELYKFVSCYSELGRLIWKDKNQTKYDNYVIY